MKRSRGDEIVFGAIALTVWLAIPALAGTIGWRWGAEYGMFTADSLRELTEEVRAVREELRASTVVRGVPLHREGRKKP
mgnify:CR=1 FL=1